MTQTNDKLPVIWRPVGSADPDWLTAMSELVRGAGLEVLAPTAAPIRPVGPLVPLLVADDALSVLPLIQTSPRPVILARTGDDAALEAILAAGAEDCLIGTSPSPILLRHAVQRALRRPVPAPTGTATLETFWDAMPMHCALLGPAGEIVAVNEAWRREPAGHGLSGGLDVGQNYLAVCDAAGIEAAGFTSDLRAVLAGEKDQIVHEHAAHLPGLPRWFETRAWWLPGRTRALVSHLDVTDRRLSQEVLRVVAGAALLTCEAFFDGLVKQVAELFGARYAFFAERSPDAGDTLTAIAWWIDGQHGPIRTFCSADSPCAAVLAGSGVFFPTGVQDQFPICTPLQALDVDSFLGMPAYDGTGQVIGVLAVMHDGPLVGVAGTHVVQKALQMLALRAGSELDRLRADRALRTSEERLKLALDGTQAIMWEYRFDRRHMYFNQDVGALWGRDPVAMTDPAAPWWEAVHPDDRPTIERIWAACEAGEQTEFETEYRWLCRSGDYRWVMARGKVVAHGPARRCRRLIGIMLDMTERKLMEQALSESEERFRLVARATHDVIWDLDVATGLIVCTDHGYPIFGHEPVAAVSVEDSRAFVHPDDLNELMAGAEAAMVGDQSHWSIECRLRHADGSYGHAQIQAWIVRNAQGQAVRMVGSLVDVTARKRLETQLMLTNRMTSMGVLAAGVAHEINNPLAYALSNQAYVIEQLRALVADEGADARLVAALDALEEARDGARRVRDIVRDLKLFSRPDDDRLGPVDVVGVVETAIGMIAHTWRHRARLERFFEAVPPVHANASQLVQVFLNLIHNAVQAIPEGEGERHFIHVAIRPEGAERVVVEVIDSGCGIPPALFDRVFDPFYTTKSVGEGTGLGLAICQQLVGRFGGRISVDSQLGQGSTFRLELPVAVDSMPVQAAPVPDAASSGRRILVIDDEPLIGRAIRRALGSEHEVHVALGGRAALERLSTGDHFDVIFCDLMMPDMCGADLYETLAAQDSPYCERFVFLSGGAFMPRMQQFLDAVDRPHLMKPFELAALRKIVAEALPSQRLAQSQ